jgi:predicted PurR-regulated permease PerM
MIFSLSLVKPTKTAFALLKGLDCLVQCFCVEVRPEALCNYDFRIGQLLGNRYAFTIGFISAFLDLLPIVGTGMVFVPWIIGLFVFGSASEGVKLLIIYLVATVIRQLLEPKIMAHSIGLHPLATLISMYVGLHLLGGFGLVLGPGLVIIYEALRKAGVFSDPKE